MRRYHNQDYLNEVYNKIISNETEDSIKEIIKQIESLKEDAQYEADKISMFTAPEEVERRQQSLYYYKELSDLLNKRTEVS